MAQNTQKIDLLTNQAVAGQVSSSSPEVDEIILQCRKEASDSIQKLEAQAVNADVPEKLRCNLRVKALKILMSRLEGVCGQNVDAMPTDEEVKWARKLFGLEQ